jgi:hypothetical protein
MPRARVALFGLALAFLSISVVLRFGLTRQASDLDQHQLYAGRDPWAVQKVRPGDRLTQHQARLGVPQKDLGSKGGRVIQWTSPSELTLTVNEDGEIVDVWGRSLTAGDSTLIDTGLSQAEVTRILGRGTQPQEPESSLPRPVAGRYADHTGARRRGAHRRNEEGP